MLGTRDLRKVESGGGEKFPDAGRERTEWKAEKWGPVVTGLPPPAAMSVTWHWVFQISHYYHFYGTYYVSGNVLFSL